MKVLAHGLKIPPETREVIWWMQRLTLLGAITQNIHIIHLCSQADKCLLAGTYRVFIHLNLWSDSLKEIILQQLTPCEQFPPDHFIDGWQNTKSQIKLVFLGKMGKFFSDNGWMDVYPIIAHCVYHYRQLKIWPTAICVSVVFRCAWMSLYVPPQWGLPKPPA